MTRSIVHPIISPVSLWFIYLKLMSVSTILHIVLAIPTTPPIIVSPSLGEPNTSDGPSVGVIAGVIITIIVIAIIVVMVLIVLFIL